MNLVSFPINLTEVFSSSEPQSVTPHASVEGDERGADTSDVCQAQCEQRALLMQDFYMLLERETRGNFASRAGSPGVIVAESGWRHGALKCTRSPSARVIEQRFGKVQMERDPGHCNLPSEMRKLDPFIRIPILPLILYLLLSFILLTSLSFVCTTHLS